MSAPAPRMPPGPTLPPIVQWALSGVGSYRWLLRRARRYGDVFSSRYPFGTVVYVADPALIKEVFFGPVEVFRAGAANNETLGLVLGRKSLLTLDGEPHIDQKRLLLPSFHGEAIRRHGDLIADVAERELRSWPVGGNLELLPRMQRITSEVMVRVVLGLEEPERVQLFRRELQRLVTATGRAMWLWMLSRDIGSWSPAGQMRHARSHLDALIYAEIARRRANGVEAAHDNDVLGLLLAARHQDSTPLTDEELRDQLVTLLFAGHETTATALAWAFERLMRTPSVMERLIAAIADGSDDYVDAVVMETLRVRPVVSDVARNLARDIELAGYRLPAGTIVVPAISVVHRRPDIYPEPLRFHPERFLEGQPAPYTWIPFGGGTRRCLGAAFAQMEMRVILKTVLGTVRLSTDDLRPESPRMWHVTAIPSRHARAVVEPLRARPRMHTRTPEAEHVPPVSRSAPEVATDTS